jgi:hypothetical protein
MDPKRTDVWLPRRTKSKIEPGKLYKLTDSNWDADSLRWGKNITHTSTRRTGKSPWIPLGMDGFISIQQAQKLSEKNAVESKVRLHAYVHPIIGLFLNRVHCDINKPVIWECMGEVESGTIDKVAICSKLTTVTTFQPPPKIGIFTRMRFGFGCASKVYNKPEFAGWTLDWFSGRDRKKDSAANIAKMCENEVLACNAELHNLPPQGYAARSAWWMCWASTAFVEQSEKQVELFTARAAVDANLAATELGIPNFDLITLAETTMLPREDA